VEYKEVARALTQVGVLDREKELLLRTGPDAERV